MTFLKEKEVLCTYKIKERIQRVLYSYDKIIFFN